MALALLLAAQSVPATIYEARSEAPLPPPRRRRHDALPQCSAHRRLPEPLRSPPRQGLQLRLRPLQERRGGHGRPLPAGRRRGVRLRRRAHLPPGAGRDSGQSVSRARRGRRVTASGSCASSRRTTRP
ncbi:hypothetical protein LX32DRAFT_277837, partial [Colletotrichum zoysiae]